MGLFSKKREAGEDISHPKDAVTPSPSGEGFEARPTGELPTESGERGLECETSPSPTATPLLKGEAIVGADAAPHPSATQTPSPEGEGFEAQPSLEQMVLSSFDELCDIAPTLTAAELLGSEDIASIGARLRRGYSLRDAYLLSQIKLHGSNGCSHLQKTSNTHRASTHLPDDVLAAYSIFMPKASRAEIQKNYIEYLARTGKG